MQSTVYHPRNPKIKPLWKCFHGYFQEFLDHYEEKYQSKLGYFRRIIAEVGHKFLECGDLKNGFARVKCSDCHEEYLLSFSCRGRWFCPSCHQKKVLLFGEFIVNEVVYPVPHRQWVFTIPIMLRVYFRNHRELLTDLCRIAQGCLLEYFRTITGQPEGMAGMVMAIHSFGDFLHFHPHLHVLVADGLFTESGTFYVAPGRDVVPLEELFRARVIKLLVDREFLAREMGEKLLSWKNSGFGTWRGPVISKEDKASLERIAQYIIRSPFKEEKMLYCEKTGTVIYRSKPSVKIKRNFEVFTGPDFIAAVTQHIPDKGFQMVRYYGRYSNKCRGMKTKEIELEKMEKVKESELEVLDASIYEPKRIPSKTWRDLIKKVWEVDPLQCPKCGGTMKIIAFIHEPEVIEKILCHLKIWAEPQSSRSPPEEPVFRDVVFESWLDDFQNCPEELPEKFKKFLVG